MSFPSSQWGPGSWEIYNNVSGAFGQQFDCSVNFGGGSACPNTTSTGASLTTDSVSGPPASGSGTVVAYNDASGMHVEATTTAVNSADTTSQAAAGFYDTLTNNSGVSATFQIGFHVDGSISAGAGAAALLKIDILHNAYGGCPFGDTCTPPPQEWLYEADPTNAHYPSPVTLNNNYLTNAVTLAPGQSYQFLIFLDAYALADASTAGTTVTGTTDVANTLTITSFTAYDQYNNPLPASDFGSADGANYSQIDPNTVPEPGTFVTAASLGALLLLNKLRRR